MKTLHPTALAYELNILMLTAQSVDYRASNPKSALEDFERILKYCESSNGFRDLPEDEREDLLFGADALKEILDELTQFRKRVPEQLEITELTYQPRNEE